MSKKELQVLPPPRLTVTKVAPEPDTVRATARALTVNTGDPITSALTRWHAERHTRTINALTTWTHAEAGYFQALNKAVTTYKELQRTTMELAELPEAFAHEKEVRRTLRANERRQAQHVYEVNELQRLTEVAHRETELTDARQQLAAQRKHGDSTYELAWKKKHVEMLEVELDAAERRALLRQHRISLEDEPVESLDDAEYAEIDEEIDAMFRRSKANR